MCFVNMIWDPTTTKDAVNSLSGTWTLGCAPTWSLDLE